MQCKVLRRSLRIMERNEKHRNYNIWTYFPLEIKFSVFSYLKAEDLRKFALSSKACSDDVLTYIQSASGLAHIQRELCQRSSAFQNCEICIHENGRAFGLLLRSVTITCSRQVKVQIAFDVVSRLKWTLEHFECEDFFCFGVFQRTFFAKWSKYDLMQTYPYVQRIIGMGPIVKQVLKSAPGRFILKERAIRHYYHHAYFMLTKKSQMRFWLGIILMNLPFVHQAKILYILFGPTRPGFLIDWASPLSNSSIMLPSDLTKFAAVVSLLVEHESFTDDDVLTLIGEIIALPQPWHNFHVAHFLLSCEQGILVSYMSNVLANGRYNDLCIFIFRCSWVLLKQGKEVTKILNAVSMAVSSHNASPADSNAFLEQLPVFLHHVAHTEEREIHGVAKAAVHRVVAELLGVMLKHKRHLAEVFQPRNNISCRRISILREE